jgi:hypothetical protein
MRDFRTPLLEPCQQLFPLLLFLAHPGNSDCCDGSGNRSQLDVLSFVDHTHPTAADFFDYAIVRYPDMCVSWRRRFNSVPKLPRTSR